MIVAIKNEVLELDYSCKTNSVSYSIADFVGNVIKRGDYDCLQENKLAINDLKKGIYMLCIVDGEHINKASFQKD